MKFKSLPKVLVALFATCLMSCAFIACKDLGTAPKEVELKQQKREISVENGRLKFVDVEHFKEVLRLLSTKKSSKELDAWEQQFAGFVSQRTAFNKITEKDVEKMAKSNSIEGYEDYAMLVPDYDGESKRLVKQVEGDAFGTLFSKDGTVIIGNNGYLYTREKIVKFVNLKKDDFSRYKKGESLTNMTASKIKVGALKSNLKVKEISNAEHCTDYYLNNRRFAADYNLHKCDGGNCNFEDGFFLRITANALHQRRLFGIWWTSESSELRREGFFVVGSQYTLSSGQQYNVGNLSASQYLGPDAQNVTYVQVKVVGTDGGNTGECTCQSN